ncbi:Fur family transcriptional regulator [Clostridium sp.]|uniref:Fur family transcriptional regulator n=1 Tax=Clostridium sp. TaxID=1506 RepID=UPI0026373EDA|nr:Fur family transcriptional regulator [Clostridium sp.]
MEVKEIFKAKGIKVTKARILIYQLLKETDRSITADYIYGNCTGINLSTVYRTLEIFLEKDLVDKFELGDGKSSYNLKKKNLHKHILECDLCHKEIEVPCPMRQIEELLRNQTGFKIKEHNLTLKGICEQCIKENEK